MLRQKKSGFTLIELLVVIAIIAILAAILFPVFAQARAQARKTTCLSNVKQISLGVLMYDQDYDETFPLAFIKVNPANPEAFIGTTASWHNLVQPYVKNWGLMICPDVDILNRADPRNFLDPFLNYGMPGNAASQGAPYFTDGYYLGNPGLGGAQALWDGLIGQDGNSASPGYSGWNGGGGKTATSSPMAALGSPASMTMVSDASAPDWWTTYFNVGNTDTFWYCVTWYAEYRVRRFGPIARHLQASRVGDSKECNNLRASGGQFDIAFTDGHSKSFPVRQYFTTKRTNLGQTVYQYLWPAE